MYLFFGPRRGPTKDHHPQEADEDGGYLHQQAVRVLPLPDPDAEVNGAGEEDEQRRARYQDPRREAPSRVLDDVAELAVPLPELVDALHVFVIISNYGYMKTIQNKLGR